MAAPQTDWIVDPDDPRAPPMAVWERLSPEQRARAVAALPSSLPPEMVGGLPEGDDHAEPVHDMQDTLRGHFGRTGRDAYVGSDLAVYYPDERVFAPDLFVVLGAGSHKRERWMVQHEGRGLDVVIKVLVRGNAKKDLTDNVERYARLGIPEYLVYQPLVGRLSGYRLVAGSAAYERILPQGGRFACRALGLDLIVMDGRLRFLIDESPLPNTSDLNRRLNRLVDQLSERAEDAARRAEAESQRAAAEARRAEAAERRLAEALRRLKQYEPDASPED